MNNVEVRNRIQNAAEVRDDLLTKRRLRCMAKTILQGTVKGARRRRQKKRWEGNIKNWTGMEFGDSLRAAEDREDREGWKGMLQRHLWCPDDLRG